MVILHVCRSFGLFVRSNNRLNVLLTVSLLKLLAVAASVASVATSANSAPPASSVSAAPSASKNDNPVTSAVPVVSTTQQPLQNTDQNTNQNTNQNTIQNTVPPAATTNPVVATSQVVVQTIAVTESNSAGGGVVTVIVSSTTEIAATSYQTPATLSTSTTTSALPSASTTAQPSSGLSAGGTIAVAVVVPVASVAVIILALLFWWNRRKAKKAAAEERRKEVEEYSFNPNDPTLPAVGGVVDSGYRGWGTTSNPRKPSTNLSSGAGIGLALSDNGSAAAYHHPGSPSEGTVQYSDGTGRPDSGDSETIAALGTGPAAAVHRQTDIHRGPSNASSAYTNPSEASEDVQMASSAPGGPFYDDATPYYGDMNPQQGPYDAQYGGTHPVIRDVQARRNTRIENPSVFPQQGNSGIAQNF